MYGDGMNKDLEKHSPINEFFSGKQPKIQCLRCGSGNFHLERNYGIDKIPERWGQISLRHNGNDDITISCQDCGASMTAYKIGGHWDVEEDEPRNQSSERSDFETYQNTSKLLK